MYVCGKARASRLAADPGLGHQGQLLAPLEPLAVAGGQQLDHVGAGVVPGAGVLGARVAETDGQQVGRRPAATAVTPRHVGSA